MSRTSLTIEQILTILTATPSYIAELTAGLTKTQVHAAPGPGEWSMNDVLAHLRSCADVWGNCIMTIVHQDRPTIRTVSPRTWIKSTDYLEQKFKPSLRAFTAQRAELLAVLEPPKPKIWSRSAVITGAGNILEWTVQSYAQRMAVHERAHLNQMQSTVSALQK